MSTSELTKNQKSFLLFIESAAVESGGLLVGSRMNNDDIQIANNWADEGFIQFGAIAAASINCEEQYVKTHWVVLSDNAWKVAHQLRLERASRLTQSVKRERVGYVVTSSNEPVS